MIARVNEWIETARRRLADELGAPATDYTLTGDAVEQLLELARESAHASGDRTQAPLASYLVGLAHGRHPERSLAALVDAFTGRET
jgi:hypothetical protein